MASSFQRRNAVLSEEAALQLSSKAFPKSAGQGVLWTSDPRIELPTKIPATASVVNPVTMMEAFAQTVRTCHSDIALRVKRGGVWIEWTYGQYYDSVKLFGRACLHPRVALRRFQGVSILAANNPEWWVLVLRGLWREQTLRVIAGSSHPVTGPLDGLLSWPQGDCRIRWDFRGRNRGRHLHHEHR